MRKLLAFSFGAVLLLPIAAQAQSDDDHRHDPDWNRGNVQQNDDRHDRDRERWAREHGYRNGYARNGYGRGAYGAQSRVRSVQGSAVTLEDGRTVFLKDGTSINGSIYPGEVIQVQGSPAGDGNINASNVTVLGR